jgi:hypothetical protein
MVILCLFARAEGATARLAGWPRGGARTGLARCLAICDRPARKGCGVVGATAFFSASVPANPWPSGAHCRAWCAAHRFVEATALHRTQGRALSMMSCRTLSPSRLLAGRRWVGWLLGFHAKICSIFARNQHGTSVFSLPEPEAVWLTDNRVPGIASAEETPRRTARESQRC